MEEIWSPKFLFIIRNGKDVVISLMDWDNFSSGNILLSFFVVMFENDKRCFAMFIAFSPVPITKVFIFPNPFANKDF